MNDPYLWCMIGGMMIGGVIGALTVRLMDHLCDRTPRPPRKGIWVLSANDGKKLWIGTAEEETEEGEEWKNGAPLE